MKNKIIIFILLLLIVTSVHAQDKIKIAIVDLKAGVGRTQAQVNGLSDMLTASLFETGRFTIVERMQVNKIVQERNFQTSNLGDTEIRTIGNTLGVDALLIGTINFIINDRTVEDVITGMASGEYNIDIRLVKVSTGEILSAAGGNQYSNQTERNLMRTIANELTENLLISNSSTNKKEAIILYGYLYVYPEDLGKFSIVPHTIITAINKNNTFGFNDWRLPTEEERDLLLANRNRLGLVNNSIYAHNNNLNNLNSYSVRLVRTEILVQKINPTPDVITYVANPVYDFGTVPVLSGFVTARFVIQNPTKTGLFIANVQTNTSWIIAEYLKNIISPGESTTIIVKINTNGRHKTIINRNIIATLSNGEKLILIIKGYID